MTWVPTTTPAGSGGSTIVVQEEGGTVTGGPHDTLNFVGASVTATDGGGGVATITVTGGGATVTENTLATIKALSPTAGDLGFPTDSPYVLYGGNSGWVYQYRGLIVTPPASGDWSSYNLTGASALATSDGTITLTLDNTGTTVTRQSAVATLADGETHVLGILRPTIQGEGTSIDAFNVGFRESSTDKIIIIQYNSGTAGTIAVTRHATIDASAASTPFSQTEVRHIGDLVWFQLVRSGGNITISVSKHKTGPWRQIHTEAEGSYFTTAPNQVLFGAVNRSGLDGMPVILVHHTVA